MTGSSLKIWMDKARIGTREMARKLTVAGGNITPQRISQWKNGESISEYWAARIEQVMSQIDAEDASRLAERMSIKPKEAA